MLKDIKNRVPFTASASSIAVHLEFDPPLLSKEKVSFLQNSMGDGGKFATFHEESFVGGVMDVNIHGVIPGQQIMFTVAHEPVIAKVLEA